MKYLRRWTYRLGFRPPLGHPLHSPSLEFSMYVAPALLEAMAEGLRRGSAKHRAPYRGD